jgi:hypothetical protein
MRLVLSSLIVCCGLLPSAAFAQAVVHPRDQIALQLGALQMGYNSPFTLSVWPSAAERQLAINALAQGRLSLGTFDGQVTVHVVGASNLPTNAEIFREQLDLAVEAVMKAPAIVRLKGRAALSNNRTVAITAALTLPSPAWMIPLPYSVDAKYSPQTVPAGPAGERGEVGPMGPGGDRGEPGPQGESGPPGEKGERGDRGEIGPLGSQGVAGPAGPKGDKGDQGEVGPQGPAGSTGPQGPKGDKGETGGVGPIGLTGARGETGPQGSQGLKGEVGPQGPAGSTGPRGLLGEAGPQGPAGPPGGQGPQGPAGAKGDQGAPAQMNNVVFRSYVAGEPTSVVRSSGMNYQGVLLESQGAPVNGTRTFGIKLFDDAIAGTELYAENVGVITVTKGVYSFEFGNAGTSNSRQSESVAVTDGTTTTFQRVLSVTNVVSGSVSVSDGTYTWTQASGSSNEDAFGVAYSTSLRRVTVNYYNGAPTAGRTITATYRTPTSGIAGALAGNNQPWAEIAVDGVAQAPRQEVLAVPFAARAAIAESVQSSTSERTFVVNLWNDGSRGLGKTFAIRNQNVQISQKAFLESYLDVIPFGGVLKSIKANVHDTSTGANSSTVFLRVYKVDDSNALVQVASSESGNGFNGGSVQLTVDLQALSLAKTKPSSFLVSLQSNGTSGDITYFPNGDLRVDSVEVTFSVTE